MGILYLVQLPFQAQNFWDRFIVSNPDSFAYHLRGIVGNNILFTSTISEKFIRVEIRKAIGSNHFIMLKIVDVQTIGNARALGFAEELLTLK
jgi:hypothetical protein